MTMTEADALRLFPYSVLIADPDTMMKDALTEWELANRETEWRRERPYAPGQNWSADPGGAWQAASSKTYRFKSPQDADLFQRRFD